LYVKIESPTGVRHHKFSLKGPITMNAAINPLMIGDTMEAGRTYVMEMYDPVMGMSIQPMRLQLEALESISVDDKRYNTKRVKATLGSVQMRLWVTDSGEQIRREFLLDEMIAGLSGT